MLHPIAWVAWTAAVAVSATLTQNPFYLAIMLGVVAIQFVAAGKHHPSAQGWRSLLRLVLGLALLVIPFNALNAHAGDHVLLHLSDGALEVNFVFVVVDADDVILTPPGSTATSTSTCVSPSG